MMDVQRLQRDIERAQNPAIAGAAIEHAQAREQFNQKLEEMLDAAMPQILQLAGSVLEFIQFVGPAISMLLDGLNALIALVQSITNWFLGNGFQSLRRDVSQIAQNTQPPAGAGNLQGLVRRWLGADAQGGFNVGQPGNRQVPPAPNPATFPNL